ncbi:hypothetical protein L580_2741 [Serratia fonticola AU-P3(3)]|nr:hypothetical protein L580_2741 [Serratia fonticola AU-P3(3)]
MNGKPINGVISVIVQAEVGEITRAVIEVEITDAEGQVVIHTANKLSKPKL